MAPRPRTPLASVKPEVYPLLSREVIGGLKFVHRQATGGDERGGERAVAAGWDQMTGVRCWHKPTYDADHAMRLIGLISQDIPAWREVTTQAATALMKSFPRHVDWSERVEARGNFAHSLMLATIISGEGRYSRSCEQIISTMNERDPQDLVPAGAPRPNGTDCEIGRIYPVCVSAVGLAARMFDMLYGTDYGQSYANRLAGASRSEDPFAWSSPYLDHEMSDGITAASPGIGAFLMYPALEIAPVDPQFALRIYEHMCWKYGVHEDDGWHLHWPDERAAPHALGELVANAGAFALAHEFNDEERLFGLRQWFENRYEPSYGDGEFSYSFGFERPWPLGIPNVWATMAHVGEAGAMRRMYNEPNMDKFSQATVSGVDYPAVAIRQAYYDAEKDALIVGTTTGVGRPGTATTFTVTGLDVDEVHEVVMDGRPTEAWTPVRPGEIAVHTTIDDHTFVVR